MQTFETFGVPPDAASDTHLIDGLHLEHARILERLSDLFPLLVGVDNNSPEKRTALFESGMSSTELPAKFGDPWTAGRLQAVIAHCTENSWPDFGTG